MDSLALKSIQNYCVQQERKIAELKDIIQKKDEEIARLKFAITGKKGTSESL